MKVRCTFLNDEGHIVPGKIIGPGDSIHTVRIKQGDFAVDVPIERLHTVQRELFFKTVIGLDCATTTGFAVIDITTGKLEKYGEIKLRETSRESRGIIFVRFRRFLNSLIEIHTPKTIFFEQPHLRGSGSELLVGLTTIIEEVVSEHESSGMSSMSIHTASLKKWVAGHGKAGKSDMVKSIKNIHRIEEDIGHDMADAIAVATWGAENMFGAKGPDGMPFSDRVVFCDSESLTKQPGNRRGLKTKKI